MVHGDCTAVDFLADLAGGVGVDNIAGDDEVVDVPLCAMPRLAGDVGDGDAGEGQRTGGLTMSSGSSGRRDTLYPPSKPSGILRLAIFMVVVCR